MEGWRLVLHKSCNRRLLSVKANTAITGGRSRSFKELRQAAGTVSLTNDLVNSLDGVNHHLFNASSHLFTGGGKYFRPTCVMLMGRACNVSASRPPTLPPHVLNHQKRIALVAEMIHVASLIHDDVLDEADKRRSLPTVNHMYNDKVAILSGDYVIARATAELASIGCSQTIQILSNVIRDLISGEIMQLDTGVGSDVLFEHYIKKTYLKTASLLAHSCKAVALHSPRDELLNPAFEYGKNIGIAFQLIDDRLDFVSTTTEMGKNTGADLKLGLATAPVLYAAVEHPQLLDLARRRFGGPGDVDCALELVKNSDGIQLTKNLAKKYCDVAIDHLSYLPESEYKDALVVLTDIVLDRSK